MGSVVCGGSDTRAGTLVLNLFCQDLHHDGGHGHCQD